MIKGGIIMLILSQDKNLIIKPYFEDMVTVLKACDIAVSRAGSLSISELCASSIATIRYCKG